ncbi:MAG: hypothetical protein JW730_12390, partial [Anaerolineales bacterium]|nr:hypothetical protein [Anaerolineales bacterium]
ILAGKADLRVIIAEALERRRLHNERTLLFVKEVLEALNEKIAASCYESFSMRKAMTSYRSDKFLGIIF